MLQTQGIGGLFLLWVCVWTIAKSMTITKPTATSRRAKTPASGGLGSGLMKRSKLSG
jgi:hypothetical protein